MRAFIGLTAAALLAGCSSYKVVKLEADGTIPRKAAGGVPVTLGRPQFTVKKVEGSDPEQYQVSVTYVPDPDHRYAVRLASTPLANADLSLAFSDAGALSSSTATVKDQIAPTTLALFKVAASVVTGLGPVGFLSKDQVKALPECFPVNNFPSQGQRARCVLTLLAADPASKCHGVADADDGLIARLAPFIDNDLKDKGEPAKTLFARGTPEDGCLEEAKAKVEGAINDTTLDPDSLVDDMKAEFQASFQVPAADAPRAAAVRNAATAALEGAISKGDVTTIKRWYYVASDPALDAPKLRSLLPSPLQIDLTDGGRIAAAIKAANLSPEDKQATGLIRVQKVADARAIAAAFGDARTLTPAMWRSRYIVWLQKRIEEAERSALVANASGDVRFDAKVRGYREQIAALAGVRGEFDRWMEFQKKLSAVPAAPAADQRISPASEYENLRSQAGALEQGIAAAIAARLTSEPAKKAEVMPPVSPWVGSQCIDKSKEEAWRFRAGAALPQFVIVLKQANGTAIAPPKGAMTCTGS